MRIRSIHPRHPRKTRRSGEAVRGSSPEIANICAISSLPLAAGISKPRVKQPRCRPVGRRVLFAFDLSGFCPPLRVWEPPMPRIQDRVLDAVVYLYDSKDEALAGEAAGGSGFLVGVKTTILPPPASFIYAVTNRHIIESGATCIRLNTMAGDIDVFPFTKADWEVSLTDDLAIISMPDIADVFKIHSIPADSLISEQFVIDHDIGVGDEVMMLGRFLNRDGIQKNTPTARFGHLAQMPGEFITVEIGGKPFDQKDAFLIEARSISGFSGSPVYVLPNRNYVRNGKPLPEDVAVILGIDFCHLVNGQSAQKPNHNVIFNEHTGMAGVVPAWKLREMLNSDKNKAKRTASEEAEQLRRKNAGIA
jgi:hypothetical protein